jgi:hypothetical protein
VWAARVLVELDVQNKPTQRIEAGDRDVLVLSFRVKTFAESQDDLSRDLYFKNLTIFRESIDSEDQILRYKLVKNDGTILKRVSLPGSDLVKFNNLNYQIRLNSEEVFSILVDTSFGDFTGKHRFMVKNSRDFEFSEKKYSENIEVEGVFPIKANMILIGNIKSKKEIDNHKNLNEEEFVNGCNMREEPVCGVDFKTYFNRCFSFNKGVEVMYEGVCKIDRFKASQQLKEAQKCENQSIEKICGSNNITYENSCFLKKAGISEAYKGECFPENYEEPKTLTDAVELFRRKKEQLKQVRPRIDERVIYNLDSIEIELSNFKFLQESHQNLIDRISYFLKFSELLSSRDRLFQELELVRIAVIEAKQTASKVRYEAGEIPFLDVDINQWYFEYVQFLKNKNWIHGYLNKAGENLGVFNPSGSVTKAEITKMSLNVAGFTKEKIISDVWNPLKNNKINDHWAKELVNLAENANFSLWKSFSNPEKKASRAEVLELVLESFGVFAQNFKTATFTDVKVEHKYFKVIETAAQLGIISGYPDGNFKPDQTVTRAEAAKILTKSFQILGQNKINWKNKLDDLEFYGMDYESEPQKFSMKIPGLFKFATFDSQKNGEIIRYGFTYMGKNSDSVDFWLSIQDNYEYLETRQITQKGNLISIKIPDANHYYERYFLIEGPSELLPVMEFFANNLI